MHPGIAAQPPAALPERRQAPPCAIVVFGATGDLTRRKLLPALYSLAAGGGLPSATAIVGVARRPLGAAELAASLREGVAEAAGARALDPATWDRLADGLRYVAGSFEDPATYRALAAELAALDAARGLGGNRLFYLAVPPAEFAPILEGLAAAGLVHPPDGPSFSRVVVEKPFGRDLASARALNAAVAAVLDESQTFRIDHYLGKETVQNILVFRFANTIFEPLWNRGHVDYVEITAAETVGVGSRGRFYEQTGVLRDIVQNHLLEVLALVAMEPPNSFAPDAIRGEKLKVLQALRPLWPGSIGTEVLLGQYDGYRAEPNVDPASRVPTYAALKVHIDNWRWQGVPFYLRAGKRLARRATEVAVHIKPIPLCLFGKDDVCERIEPNVLTLRIQPDEGIELRFASKVPGHDFAVGSVRMDMSYTEAFGGEPPEAYERLLFDAMRGDATLFSRRDAVEASWAWIDPLLAEADDPSSPAPAPYAPGSWGPSTCDAWLARDGRRWREP